MTSQKLQDSPSYPVQPVRPRKRAGFFKLVTVSSLLVGGAVAGAMVARQPWLDRLVAIATNRQPAPQVDVRTLVVQQVRGASELTTAVFTMEAVVPTKRDRTLAGYTVGTTTLLYIGYGEIRAGVDLSQLTPEDITVQSDRITVQLPSPEILDSKIDVNRSTVYDYDRGFLSLGPDAAPQLHELAQQATLAKITEAACEQNLLSDANTRAEQVIRQLLTTAGYSEVVVRTQPVDPATCLARASQMGSAPATPVPTPDVTPFSTPVPFDEPTTLRPQT